MKTGNRYLIPLGLAAALLLPQLAVSDESEDIIKYRQGVMKAIGGHMSASSLIVRGKVSYKPQLQEHAKALKILLAEACGVIGPARLDDADCDDFIKAADVSKQSIADFLAAVEQGKPDAIAAGFQKVGDGCKGCHKDFREKDD